jgi:thiol-disulfide isomerase/thioredoxin
LTVKKRNALILLGTIVAVIAVVVWQWPGAGQEAESAASAPLEGEAAPAFSLPVLDGNQVYSVGGRRDKPLIVNFWASWCGPCEKEMPELKALYEKYKDRIDLYAVNATKYDTLRGARDFVREMEPPFPVLTDEDGKVTEAYKVVAFPVSFIIGRDGVILERIERLIGLEEWEQKIKAAL